jgi:FixJ family two-component response regulator
MNESGGMVYIVDDDDAVRDGIRALLNSVGIRAEVFPSTEAFQSYERPEVPSCLVLDVQLPGQTGIEFQEALALEGVRIPIIFVTAHGDVRMTSRAMRAGAVEFLTKPFQKDEFLNAVHQALDRDRARRKSQAEISILLDRQKRLTARENEVMFQVVRGLLNKQVAAELGITEITVKIHRSRVMQKMEADSLPELVRMVERLKSHAQSA